MRNDTASSDEGERLFHAMTHLPSWVYATTSCTNHVAEVQPPARDRVHASIRCNRGGDVESRCCSYGPWGNCDGMPARKADLQPLSVSDWICCKKTASGFCDDGDDWIPEKVSAPESPIKTGYLSQLSAQLSDRMKSRHLENNF
jgi:hypothetical protein